MTNKKMAEAAPRPPSVSPEIGIDLLSRLVADGDKLLNNRPISSISKKLWENKAKDYFERAFGSNHRNIGVVLNAGVHSFNSGQSEAYYEDIRFRSLAEQVQAVNSIIELLQLEIDLNTNCPNCGQMYPRGRHNYCLNCGTALIDLTETKTEVLSALDPATLRN
jgi:transposase